MPDRRRGILVGVLTAIGLSVVWVIPAVILDNAGLLALAAVGGWVLGTVVRRATWGGSAHPPDRSGALIAATLGALTWLGGTFLDYVASLALVPGSALTLRERLAGEPFPTWLAPQLLPLGVVELLLIGVIAWRSAR